MRVLHEPELTGVPTGTHRPGPTFSVHGPDDPAREPVQRFIATGFERCFGARIDNFMPYLVTLRRDGEILAAAGYRQAFEPLFLETYLDEPVERSLARTAGSDVNRSAIAELGQLATRAPRHLTVLINQVSAHLVRQGVSWVAITATRSQRRTRPVPVSTRPDGASTTNTTPG